MNVRAFDPCLDEDKMLFFQVQFMSHSGGDSPIKVTGEETFFGWDRES